MKTISYTHHLLLQITRGLMLLLSVTLVSLLIPATSYAFSIWPSAACQTASSSAVCSTSSSGSSSNPISGTKGIILIVANLIAIVAGVAAVIVLIIAGLNYITANGEAAKTQKAKTTIVYAIVGLLVIALAHSILGLIIIKLS